MMRRRAVEEAEVEFRKRRSKCLAVFLKTESSFTRRTLGIGGISIIIRCFPNAIRHLVWAERIMGRDCEVFTQEKPVGAVLSIN